MYECRPPKAVNRFMRNDTAIALAFARAIPDPVQIEYYWGLPENVVENALAPSERPGWQVRFHFHRDLEPMAGAAYAMHGDLAITGDRAGIAMSHIRTYTERQPHAGSETTEPRPVIHNDFVFSFEADLGARSPDGASAPREVQIRWYRQLAWELIARGFYIASVTFDGFQSTDMIQIFLSRGIGSKVLSVDRTPVAYQTLKDVIYDGRLECYYRLRVKNELETLRVTNRGTVDHVPGGSKDEADALAGSVVGAIEVGGDEGDQPVSANLDSFVFAYGAPTSTDLSAFGSDLSFGATGNLAELSFGANHG